MRFRSTVLFPALLLTGTLTALATPHLRRGPTAQHLSKKGVLKAKPVSQRGIDSSRATQIQTALISQGYLTGTPTGTWNPETQDALRKLQSDNGWQTKVVPDSRAIIKLGLGPNSPSPEGAVTAFAPLSTGQPTIEPETSIPAQQ